MGHYSPSSGPGVPQSQTWPGPGADSGAWQKEVQTLHRCLEFGSSPQRVAQPGPQSILQTGCLSLRQIRGASEGCCRLDTLWVDWHPDLLSPSTWHMKPLSPTHTPTQMHTCRSLGTQIIAKAEGSETCFPPSLGGEGCQIPPQFNPQPAQGKEA